MSPHYPVSPALSGIIRHYPALSGIIRHYPALSGIIRHYPHYPGIIPAAVSREAGSRIKPQFSRVRPLREPEHALMNYRT